MALLHLLNPFKVIEHTAHTVFDVVEYKTHKLLDLAGHKVELVKDVTHYVKEAIDYKAELVHKILDAKHSYLSDLVEFKYESLLNVLEIKADKLTHVKAELIDLIGKHHDDHGSIHDIKGSIFGLIEAKAGIALHLVDKKVDFIHDLLHIKAHKIADLAELKAKLVADILDIKADKEGEVTEVVNGEGNEQAQLTVTIASQDGHKNGSLLVEVTDKDGNVEVIKLTHSYDANVGKTFALDIENGATVRLGITAGDKTIWSDSEGVVLASDITGNSATIGFEDNGPSHADFNDVVLEATLVGDASAKLPENVTFGGEIIYPIDVHQDFEDMADMIHGDWEYVEAPEGWFTDNKSGKIEIGFGREYGLKGNDDVVVELETSHHDKPHNLYTMIDSQSDAEVVIEFDYSGRKGHLGIYSDFEVVVDGKVIETIVPDQVGFVSKSITVPGTGEIMRVEFRAINGDSYGAVFNKINVKQVFLNEAPIAEDDSATGVEENTLVIAVADLLANDSDPDGDDLFDFSVHNAVNGNVSLVGNTVEFYPDAGYTGPASFTYTITDGKGGFDTATVNLTIEAKLNEAPVAKNDDLTGTEDIAVMTAVADLLANDMDADGDALSIVSVQNAVNGVVELVGDKVVFTPNADYNGPASYTYTITDGDKESTATVNLTIVAANDNPVAMDDYLGEFIEGQPIAINVADVLSNDSDIDGDAIRANSVIDSVGGYFAMIDGVPTFVPDAGFIGDAKLTYQITDDKGGFDTATITFKMIADPNPNQNPVANDDNLGQFLADQPAAIDVAQVLSNDVDPDGDALSATAVVATQNGQFAFIDGVPSFIPDAGFIGTASLTYKVEDGNGGSDTATIYFEFIDPDQAPIAEDDMAEGLSNNDLVIDPATLLANDVDPEGKPLTLVSVGNPVNGTVAIVGGQIIFTPDAEYKGPASFTYVVADPAGNENTATVNLAINDNAIYGTPNDDIPLNGTENNDYIKGLEGDDTINGLGGDDFIYGGPGKDTIDGGDGDDTLLGGYDDDRIEGGKGNDTINGNQGNDTLKGGEGDDTMSGSSGNDLLLGQDGNDTLYGDAGDDTLEGGAGDDMLFGGQENDVLTGGLGADTFVWTGNDTQPNGNGRETDIVTDFNAAEDKLDLADLLSNEQNSDNLDRYLDFSYDSGTGDTTIAVSVLGSFEKSDDTSDYKALADQLIVLEGVDLTAGNTIADENIIQNMLNNNQLIVDSL